MRKALVLAVAMMLAGCATVSVNSRQVGSEHVVGVTYNLPMTALSGEVTYTLVEYTFANKKVEKYLEIRDPVTLKSESYGDKSRQYLLEAKQVEDNVFVYSNLKFSLSERGYLTGANVEVKDHTLDAIVSGITLVSKLGPLFAGLPPMPGASLADAERSEEDNLPVSEKILKTYKEQFTFIPSVQNTHFELPLPTLPGDVRGTNVVVAKVTIGDSIPGTPAPEIKVKEPFDNATFDTGEKVSGVWYRKADWRNVALSIKNPGQATSSTFEKPLPLLQFGVINRLPLEGKALTDRGIEITFDANGNLASYGAKSESSADKALTQANTATDTLLKMKQHMDTQEAAQEAAARKAEINRIKQAQLLAEWAACVAENGPGKCKEKLDALIANAAAN